MSEEGVEGDVAGMDDGMPLHRPALILDSELQEGCDRELSRDCPQDILSQIQSVQHKIGDCGIFANIALQINIFR